MEPPSGQEPVLVTDRLQAHGWLVARFSVAAIGAVAWAYLATLVLDGGTGSVVGALVFGVLGLGLLGTATWGRRASRGLHPVPTTGGGGRRGRLRRERQLTEEAARHLGWSPTLVAGVHRTLVAVSVVLMVVTAVAWLGQRG